MSPGPANCNLLSARACGVAGAAVGLPWPGITETDTEEPNRDLPDGTLIGEVCRDEDGDPTIDTCLTTFIGEVGRDEDGDPEQGLAIDTCLTTFIGEVGRDEDGDPEHVLAIDIAIGLEYPRLTFPIGSDIAIASTFFLQEKLENSCLIQRLFITQ